MMNLVCGIIAVAIITAFAAGLAVSIYESTHSPAFPIITAIVLAMVLYDFWESVRGGLKSGSRD